LSIIEKDQQYIQDEFVDMEKKKETLAFRMEADKKLKEWKGFVLTKDKLRM